jgi:hypothetical protein
MRPKFGSLRPPIPPDLDTGQQPSISPSNTTQPRSIPSTTVAGINAQSSLSPNLKIAGNCTSGQSHGRNPPPSNCPSPGNHNHANKSLQTSPENINFNPEISPVASLATQPLNNANFGDAGPPTARDLLG